MNVSDVFSHDRNPVIEYVLIFAHDKEEYLVEGLLINPTNIYFT